jgi:hypothetical protein
MASWVRIPPPPPYFFLKVFLIILRDKRIFFYENIVLKEQLLLLQISPNCIKYFQALVKNFLTRDEKREAKE